MSKILKKFKNVQAEFSFLRSEVSSIQADHTALQLQMSCLKEDQLYRGKVLLGEAAKQVCLLLKYTVTNIVDRRKVLWNNIFQPSPQTCTMKELQYRFQRQHRSIAENSKKMRTELGWTDEIENARVKLVEQRNLSVYHVWSSELIAQLRCHLKNELLLESHNSFH